MKLVPRCVNNNDNSLWFESVFSVSLFEVVVPDEPDLLLPRLRRRGDVVLDLNDEPEPDDSGFPQFFFCLYAKSLNKLIASGLWENIWKKENLLSKMLSLKFEITIYRKETFDLELLLQIDRFSLFDGDIEAIGVCESSR